MGPARLILFFLCFLALPTFLTFFSLLYSHPPQGPLATESADIDGNGRLRAFFSFRAPSTLFPSSAIISLTDDNSTFFLARPADFGPKLAPEGFSGQLWVGIGFGEPSLSSGWTKQGAEGELGCSDIPGWRENAEYQHVDADVQAIDAGDIIEDGSSSSHVRRARRNHGKEDGTDDYLHRPHLKSITAESSERGDSSQYETNKHRYSSPHADIQSLQESAEMAGKIVLLSRGGCGFLEKVKWTQRRGGAALIVGDDTPGGPLITMFARGDTSNVTIPALFTSHTTAHLLSSLIPPDRPKRHSWLNDPLRTSHKEGKADKVELGDHGAEAKKPDIDNAISTHAAQRPQTASLVQSSLIQPDSDSRTAPGSDPHGRISRWFDYLLSRMGFGTGSRTSDLSADSRRPPSSGRLDWTIDEWNVDGQSGENKDLKQETAVVSHNAGMKARNHVSSRGSTDGFIIGVHDWRDKDLVQAKAPSDNDSNGTGNTVTKAESSLGKTVEALGEESKQIFDTQAGGIIIPSSGEYESPGAEPNHNILSSKNQNSQHESGEHEGLWVTLTPTTMSASPFLDTLLVLVVSPLITLTVVYALLLLRSRIRRRRWRAPKSVVDRLPVRTYHTMSCSSTSSSQSTSPLASSPTCPLLQKRSRHTSPSRSETTSVISGPAPMVADQAAPVVLLKQPRSRTRQTDGKRKYAGKQIECVVCLEEYVDGRSRVMSLPCGHEFHAECMYVCDCHVYQTCPG